VDDIKLVSGKPKNDGFDKRSGSKSKAAADSRAQRDFNKPKKKKSAGKAPKPDGNKTGKGKKVIIAAAVFAALVCVAF